MKCLHLLVFVSDISDCWDFYIVQYPSRYDAAKFGGYSVHLPHEAHVCGSLCLYAISRVVLQTHLISLGLNSFSIAGEALVL